MMLTRITLYLKSPSAINLLPPINEVRDKVIFYTCLWFCSQGGSVCPIACWDTPPGLTPPAHNTPRQIPPRQTPPRPDNSPPRPHSPSPGYYGLWLRSGRYASYLNSYLFHAQFHSISYRFYKCTLNSRHPYKS